MRLDPWGEKLTFSHTGLRYLGFAEIPAPESSCKMRLLIHTHRNSSRTQPGPEAARVGAGFQSVQCAVQNPPTPSLEMYLVYLSSGPLAALLLPTDFSS